VTSSNTKPEVALSHRCCHLEIVYDVIIPQRVWANLVAWCGISCRLLWYCRSSNRQKIPVWRTFVSPKRKYY